MPIGGPAVRTLVHPDAPRSFPSAPRAGAFAWFQQLGQVMRGHPRAVAAAVMGAVVLVASPGVPIRSAQAQGVNTAAVVPLGEDRSVLDYWGGGGDSLSGQAFLKKDGKSRLDTGLVPFTRSYVQSTKGALRFRNGSPPPESLVHSAEQLSAHRAKTSGQSLDAMAQVFGRSTHFHQLAQEKPLYDPAEKWWWGLCAPWAWTSLHPQISKWVDVDGPEGMRGAWFAGQWLSRADLGNWTMAVANPFVDAASEATGAESVGKPSAQSLLNALQMLKKGAPGFVADIHNDQLEGRHETWNQPFHAAEVESRTLGRGKAEAQAVAQLQALAKADGWSPAQFKYVVVRGLYGQEDQTARDAYEGPAHQAAKRWVIYAGVGEDGAVGWSIMANDPRLSAVNGLPSKASDHPPDYLAVIPFEILDDAIAGRANGYLERAGERGLDLRFYLGTVLPNLVPGHVRRDFEVQVSKLAPGPVSASELAKLAQRFPKVANAYSPAEWRQHFGARGLGAAAFGAVWP